MPLKKKVAVHKYEGEYESPDGDIYDCTVVQHGDRCYVQWQKQSDSEKNENPVVTIDGPFLEGMYEWYLDLTGKRAPVETSTTRVSSGGRPGLRSRRPSVTDHRGAQGTTIHSQVKESMRNYDDDVKPVESFSPPRHVWDGQQGTATERAGIDPMAAMEEAPDTPEQWRIDDEEGPQWKRDAKERRNMPKPQYTAKGPAGEKVRRVGAGDII